MESQDSLELLQKQNQDFSKIFQTTSKTRRALSDSFKLFQTPDITEPRNSFKLLEKQNKTDP